MPVDPEYIEQLVLEEIAGIISPEDSATLKKLLEEEPEAYYIWQKMQQVLTGKHVSSLLEALPDELPPAQILAAARKRKRHRILSGTIITVLVLLLVLLIVRKALLPAEQLVTPAPIPSFALKSVALLLPNGQVIRLGSRQQQVKAAGIVFSETAGQLSWTGADEDTGTVVLTVPEGRDYAVRLPDSSEVMLNAATTLKMPLSFRRCREVTITGEAYLRVAKDETKPFCVQLPGSILQVLGTSFNVNTYDSSRVRVALETGAIRMLTADGNVVLHPGMSVAYRAGKQPQTCNADIRRVLSWKDGFDRKQR